MKAMLLAAVLPLLMTNIAIGSQAFDPTKIVDLTHTFDKQTIYWPTEGSFHHEFEHFGMTPGGYFYSSAKYAAAEHGGTHMDAPIHFSRQGDSADKVALTSCIGPAVVIDFSERAAKDRNAMLMVADIEGYEKAYGAIPDGAIVIARSGWGKFWPDKKQYMGTDKPGDVPGLRFPGFSSDALKYLLAHRKVVAIAIDTASIDPGISKDFPSHRVWLGANKPAFENLANADKLPPSGATIFCIPMKIGQGTGGPTRIFAMLP
ncbi:MAG TPA: cyclase family protein [Candidatus Binataceae bacterium]|nr:cyclase family protein [Candidatus Binataceae bacterium]